jgi:putative flippase GtrA
MEKSTRQARTAVPEVRGPVAAFLRFVVCGGGVTLLSSAVLLLAAGHAPFAAANAVVTVASTLFATELHHRFTFNSPSAKAASEAGSATTGRAGAAGFAGWRIHAKSALTLLVAYLFTTAAVLLLGAAHPHPSPLLAQAVYLAASGLAGTGRFLVLRLVVFARRPGAASSAPLHRGEIAAAA